MANKYKRKRDVVRLEKAPRLTGKKSMNNKQSNNPHYRMGLDIGSTTVKFVLLDGDRPVFDSYKRHNSDIKRVLLDTLKDVRKFAGAEVIKVGITGSGGVLVAEYLGLPFIQEVIAETKTIQSYHPEADVIIELGGEDAKITYLHPLPEQRMNGTCAGGTGSFIDQMAQLLQTDAEGLNELASRHKTIYPIASRCGVFAKSDLQPLINEGASREDLAASVLQAVVTQTIAGLSQGRSISGQVIFLGGPLHFLPELRHAFERTLINQVERFIVPENAQLYVALGAALLSDKAAAMSMQELIERLEQVEVAGEDIAHIPPLFKDDADYEMFRARHAKAKVSIGQLHQARGPLFFGLDAGSTTTKAVLCDENNHIVFTHYAGNQGSPVESSLQILKRIYEELPEDAYIARSCSTGYGETLLKAALRLDEGEIETMAHYTAAEYFRPGVDFIVDIGGQDMKCLRVHNGVIDNIMLNEACSSGCGSFIQTFAHSLGMDTPGFAKAALKAKNPVDLGTRCTVFMNSRVKQAQKQGAEVGDISAGLSYSVVRNALYKVIKMRDPEKMGQRIVVQGGTFANDAVLRCFEQISGREVIRPNIAGLMGAFGAALIAHRHWTAGEHSKLLRAVETDDFAMKTEQGNCKLCGNRCKLTINTFNEGSRHVSGNRCERGAGKEATQDPLPNLFDYKYKRTFAYYKPLELERAYRGVIGIPRVLNIYENYPLWFTILTDLGFRVQLSARSTHGIFDKGIDSIPSESVCYPAKLTHGHVKDLIQKGVRNIFYPSLPYESNENEGANNHFNCPIVTSYPEVLQNNMDELSAGEINFIHPFLGLHRPQKMAVMLRQALSDAGFTDISKTDMEAAVRHGFAEYALYKADIFEKGQAVRAEIKEKGQKGIVLAGRPYHIDPEINHGIPELINGLGMAVLTEDAVAEAGLLQRPIRVVDQWMYHTRLYEAAAVVAQDSDLELVQLNSFGCGLDAVTTDQTQEILESQGGIYTCLKIDEVSNLGAVRIRLRSLKVAMEERASNAARREKLLAAKQEAERASTEAPYVMKRAVFTEKMVKTHTILAPQMAPIQFRLIEKALKTCGYDVKILEHASKADVETGLKYVNNDACFPTILVVGQMMEALLHGGYDPDTTALLITQTGGGCRATNYVAFLRKALKDAGMEQVPVIALSVNGIETNPGMKYSFKLINLALQSIMLGDLMQTVLLRVRPYETTPGAALELYETWMRECEAYLSGQAGALNYNQLIDGIIAAFDQFPLRDIPRKPRVGVVGEILVKFHPDANNNAIAVIEAEGCEAVMPGLADFFLYCFYGPTYANEQLGNSAWAAVGGRLGISYLEKFRKRIKKGLAQSGKFSVPVDIYHLSDFAKEILSLGNNTGEGWFLTAEMIELIQDGVPNIIMASPFACLPNHVTGKGMAKALRSRYPQANIVPIDYDPGASEVNQLNRIKLMISTAISSLEN